MEQWKEYRLGEIATFITAKSDISLFNKRNYISTENILPNRSGIKEASSLPTTGSVIAFCKNDILISNIRPYFKKIWLASFDGGCSNDVICLRAKENVSCQFLYYLLSQDAFFDYVMLGAKGTKMPRGDRNQIIKWVLTLPPLKEQHRIVSLLYSLDSKIELNRKINSNLEEQAKALFKSWFIDFEPFKGGKFIDSELGMIPEGWNVKSASDIFNITIGKTPPRKESKWFTKGIGNVWVSISDMKLNGAFIGHSSEKLSDDAIAKFNIVMVPKDTILLSFKLTIGRVAISSCDLTTNEAIARFSIDNPRLREFTYLFLKNYNYQSLGSTSSIATA